MKAEGFVDNAEVVNLSRCATRVVVVRLSIVSGLLTTNLWQMLFDDIISRSLCSHDCFQT
jgi:hypothetical protein